MSLSPTWIEAVKLKWMQTGKEPLWKCEHKGHLPEKITCPLLGHRCTENSQWCSWCVLVVLLVCFNFNWPVFEVMEDS